MDYIKYIVTDTLCKSNENNNISNIVCVISGITNVIGFIYITKIKNEMKQVSYNEKIKIENDNRILSMFENDNKTIEEISDKSNLDSDNNLSDLESIEI